MMAPLLGLLTIACVLVTPGLAIAVPLALIAGRTVRTRPSWRRGLTVAAGLFAAPAAGAIAGAVVLVACIEDSGEGVEAFPVLTAIGFVVGGLFGLVLGATGTWLTTGRALMPAPTSDASPALRRRGGVLLGIALVSIVLGVATSLVGLVLSCSLGLLTLAMAAAAVRPIALVFVAAHAAWALVCATGAKREARPSLAISGAVVSCIGVVLATTIAAFGPAFFDGLLHRSIGLMLVG